MSFKLPFFKKKSENMELPAELDNIPHHIAVIMDGNGRWAQKRGLPRVAGHKEGMDTVKDIAKAASKFNVGILTLYTFSTENWKRPDNEVDFIMRLPKEFVRTYLPEMIENNVKIDTIGNLNGIPKHTKEAVAYAKEQTKHNDGLLLNFALNYGSRTEIMDAMKHVMADVSAMKVSIDDIDEDLFTKYLYTNSLTDPDLLIRTSGEQRLSNFLLWQSAYTELLFSNELWPDFDEALLKDALYEYQRRKRKYGGV